MGKRKRFNQTAILQYFRAKCERCKKGIQEVDLTIHHKNHNAKDDRWQNIVIYCRKCHSIIEGTDKKDSQRR
jgi:5-methylcytosine-specific restriction endonuclease McrA